MSECVGTIVGDDDFYWMLGHLSPEEKRDGEPPRILFAVRDGRDVGYVVLKRKHKWPNARPAAEVEVSPLSGGPAARLALARRIVDLDLAGSIKVHGVAESDPLLSWVQGPRGLGDVRPYDSLWVRLVDLPLALAARGYEAECDVVVEVTDEPAPWNAGRWRIRVKDGTRRRVAHRRRRRCLPTGERARRGVPRRCEPRRAPPRRCGRRAPAGCGARAVGCLPHRSRPLLRSWLLSGRGRVRLGGAHARLRRRAGRDGGVRGVGLAGRYAALAARRPAPAGRDDRVVAVRLAEGAVRQPADVARSSRCWSSALASLALWDAGHHGWAIAFLVFSVVVNGLALLPRSGRRRVDLDDSACFRCLFAPTRRVFGACSRRVGDQASRRASSSPTTPGPAW